MEIKLLIVGSTLLNVTLPLAAGWKLSSPSRQAEEGMWGSLVPVAAQGPWDTAWELWGWFLLPPECTFSICSVKTAAICPRTCVLCVERCSQCPQVFAASAGVKCTFCWCTRGVPRAGRPCRGQFPALAWSLIHASLKSVLPA